MGLLSDLGLHTAILRVSIYADDAVLFFCSNPTDLEVIAAVLNIFANA